MMLEVTNGRVVTKARARVAGSMLELPGEAEVLSIASATPGFS